MLLDIYYTIQVDDLLQTVVLHEKAKDNVQTVYFDISSHLVGVDSIDQQSVNDKYGRYKLS